MYILEIVKEVIKNTIHDLWNWVCSYIETIVGVSITIGTFDNLDNYNVLDIPLYLIGINWAVIINESFHAIMSVFSGVVSAYLIHKFITKKKK